MRAGYTFVLPRQDALELAWALECISRDSRNASDPDLGILSALAACERLGLTARGFPHRRKHVRFYAPDLATLQGYWLGLDWYQRGLPNSCEKTKCSLRALLEGMDAHLTERDPVAMLASLARLHDLTPDNRTTKASA